MRRGVTAAMLSCWLAAAWSEEPPPSAEVPAVATPAPSTPSVVIKEEGLSFDVPLNQRSLREHDPHFDELVEKLPGLGTEGVPFKKGWTEELADSFHDQLVNGPGDGPTDPTAQALGARMNQMSGGGGDEDDWTWTPPSR